jgi:hypothetical protein
VRCHPSVLSHHAIGTVECDESYCIEGGHIWSFFLRGARIFFTMSHTATRASSWPYMNFLWRQFRVVETCPYMAYGRGLPIYGSLHMFLGGLKCPPPYYSKMLNKPTDPLLVTRIESWLSHIPVLSCSVPLPPPPPHPYKTCPHFLVPWKTFPPFWIELLCET